METKSLSFPLLAEDKHHCLTSDSISLDHVIAHVRGRQYGAIATFLGTVRGTENDAEIGAIQYEAYAGMAERELKKIIDQVARKWGVLVVLQHKIGKVSVGEASLAVACAGVHRKETFEACQFVVDEIKSRVPIWKVAYEWM